MRKQQCSTGCDGRHAHLRPHVGEHGRPQVTTEEGEALAQKHGMLFFECSAKDATNINKVRVLPGGTLVMPRLALRWLSYPSAGTRAWQAFERMIVEIYGLVKKPSVASPTQAAATGPDSSRAVPEHKPDLYAGADRCVKRWSPQVSPDVDTALCTLIVCAAMHRSFAE